MWSCHTVGLVGGSSKRRLRRTRCNFVCMHAILFACNSGTCIQCVYNVCVCMRCSGTWVQFAQCLHAFAMFAHDTVCNVCHVVFLFFWMCLRVQCFIKCICNAGVLSWCMHPRVFPEQHIYFLPGCIGLLMRTLSMRSAPLSVHATDIGRVFQTNRIFYPWLGALDYWCARLVCTVRC